MRASWVPLAALLALASASPLAQAAINGPIPFASDEGFMPHFEDAEALTITSGALEAELPDAAGSFGFFDTSRVSVGGITSVCWGTTPADCASSNTGGLSVVVAAGGSFGLRFPSPVDASLSADHSLALFVDFANEEDLNSFGLARSLMAPVVGGAMSFDHLPPVPQQGQFPTEEDSIGLVSLDDLTRIEVRNGVTVLRTLEGKDGPILFDGNPTIAPFAPDMVVVPFGPGGIATFEAAKGSAASQGLDLTRITGFTGSIEASNQGNAGTRSSTAADEGNLAGFQEVLSQVLAGAIVRLPQGENSTEPFADVFRLVRFEAMTVEATVTGLEWSGKAALQIEEGRVKGAGKLVGFSYFALPWWSLLLWAVAIGLFITRMVKKPEKANLRWDRFRWIGWVSGILVFLLLFWLWDIETRAIWGTSILTADGGGRGMAFIAIVQVVPLFAALFAVATPLRMIFQSTFLLTKQGTFMGLSGTLANLLAYPLGAGLILDYLGLFLSRVIGQLG